MTTSGQLVAGSFMDYTMPRADNLPNIRTDKTVTPCPMNPLGRQGLRRDRHHRLAAGGDQRRHRRAESRSASPTSTCRRRPSASGRPSRKPGRRPRQSSEEAPMYNFDYARPASLKEVESALKGASDPKILAGGMTLIPTLKQRLASPDKLVDLGGIGDLRGIKVTGDTVTIGAMTTHGAVAASKEVAKAIPALAALADGIGDPAGAQPRHDRRLDLEQRSGGRLSGGVWSASAPRSRRPSARSRPTTSSPACSRPRSSRARSSPPSASRSRRRPATASSRTRPRATPSSACSPPRPRAACASR